MMRTLTITVAAADVSAHTPRHNLVEIEALYSLGRSPFLPSQMWLHLPLFLLGLSNTAVGLKFPFPGDRYSRLSRRTNEGSGGGVRSALPARKRIESDGVAGVSDTNSKTLKDGFVVRPRVDAPQTEKPDPSPTEGLAAVGSVLTQTAGVVGATLANTAAATALLLPLHEWSLSRKRVAEAVEASEAAENKRQRTRFEQEQQKEQLQQEGRTRNDPNPWGVLLRDTFPLPRPIENTYRALASVAAVPGKLAKGSKRAAENLLAAGERLTLVGETVATMPDRAQKAIAQARGTARAAQDVAASAPARVEELVAATQELPGQVERALGEGVETITALGEAGRKAAEVAEALPRRWVVACVWDAAFGLFRSAFAGMGELLLYNRDCHGEKFKLQERTEPWRYELR